MRTWPDCVPCMLNMAMGVARRATADEAQVKALVASLAGINIEEALKVGPAVAAAPAPAKEAPAPEAKKEEEKKKEEGKKEEEAIAGLGALFG